MWLCRSSLLSCLQVHLWRAEVVGLGQRQGRGEAMGRMRCWEQPQQSAMKEVAEHDAARGWLG